MALTAGSQRRGWRASMKLRNPHFEIFSRGKVARLGRFVESGNASIF